MLPSRYKPVKISQLSVNDSRVVLLGNVTSVKDNSFVLDDGEARVEIFSEQPVERKLVRAFCNIADNKLKVDVIQNLEGLDVNLFKKIEELYNKCV